jgi:hypothetical protein
MAVAIRVKYPKPVRKDAAKDPRFQKLKGQVQGSANKVKQHPPASKKAREAQAAAQGPPNEKIAGAEANKADAMGAAETEKPQPDSFLAALRAEIEKVMPKTLDDADKFMEGGEKEQLKGSVSGSAKEQSDQASAGMKSASDAPPDTGAVPAKPVTPLPGEPAVTAPGVDTGNAVPAPKPADETSLKAGKDAAAASLKEADLDNAQLKKANDPRFSKVLKDKDAVDKNAEAGPQKYRGQEQKVLAQGVAKASGDAKAGLTQLTAVRTKSTGKVKTGQLSAKEKDEKRRKEVTDNIQKIFKETKDAVDGKLNTLETETMSQFDRGMNSALDAMKSGARAEIAKFKEERYSGVTGKGRWVADLFRPVPEEIKRITERHRQNFTKAMDGVAERVAAFVDGRLNAAKADIAKGQARIKTYVASLPKDLQAVGKAAEQDVSAKLDELRQGVEDKKNDLAQKLAQKYKEAQDRADEETKKIQDENKGYLAGLAESIGEVVKLLTEFKAKLMAVLKKGEDAIKLVLKDPIGFLGNLIGAIKLGFTQFVGNILTHLKTGFINWLFGGLAEAGVTPPPDLSLPSILTLVLQVLGLTWPQIRSLAVKKLGERNVEMLEKLVGFLMKIFNAGPAAAWAELKASLSDLKAAAIDALQNWIVTTVIQAAVTKILSMLNPAGAIVQAVIAIYNTVMFIVERIGQIMAVVEAIINSVTAIAQGAIAGAANWIEKALGGLIPVVIGLLARLAGLGKITAKITEFIRKVQGKVRGAIEKVIDKGLAWVKKLIGKGGKGKGKGKEKDKKDDKDGKPIKVSKPLSMSTEGHTITAETTGGKLVVKMASGRMMELKGAVAGAISKERSGAKRGSLISMLEDTWGQLKRIEQDLPAAIVNSDPKGEAKLLGKISNIAAKLQALGAQFNVPNLIDLGHASKYVKDNEIKKEHRGTKMRPLFYGDWNSTAIAHRATELARLQTAAKDPKWKADANFGKPGAFVVLGAYLALPTARNVHLDHTQSVSNHWNSQGNGQKQSDRESWYNKTSNLRVVDQKTNLSKGGENFNYTVAKSFRGPGE